MPLAFRSSIMKLLAHQGWADMTIPDASLAVRLMGVTLALRSKEQGRVS